MIKEVVYKADNYQRLSPRLMKSKKMGDIACKTLDTKKILNAIRLGVAFLWLSKLIFIVLTSHDFSLIISLSI